MKSLKCIMVALCAASAFNVSASVPTSSKAVQEAYLSGPSVRLNEIEQEAVGLAKKFRTNKDQSKPILAPDGSVQYYHGYAQPAMICAPLEVCVVKLEPGEKITTLQAGDNVRWQITPAVVGTPSGEPQSEIILKPTEVGLISSLYIGTDRRSYHIKLKSHRTKFIPKMSFLYPQDFNKSWKKYQQIQAVAEKRQTLPESSAASGARIEDLDFAYSIDGKARWKPERVYNDGVRTIIQMPKDLHASEAPVLLVVDESGNEKLVNSRLKGTAFIVDQVFDEAALIAGVGRDQVRVEIKKVDNQEGE